MDSFPNFEPVHFSISDSTFCFLRQIKWSGFSISLTTFQFVVISTVKSFRIANEAEVNGFLLAFLLAFSLAFSMIQQMLTI